jgi:glycosyltransferase involved in cell wall biosynthesis
MSTSGERGPQNLVTVIIPAFNAEATIDETLRSVRGQTHKNLEIIVVDDGSHDGTRAIAQRHASADPRVLVVAQANAGVAAARNLGWKLATADLLSFVDADDLWAPDKTERQVAALRAMPEAGLAYSWSVMIDADSRIILKWEGARWEGDALDSLMRENFIGNGSAALVTRRALEDAGGFDSAMRDAAAGGCEDILFYARVAERHPVALAPGYLIGYRYVPGNMSSDLPRMLRSWFMMRDELSMRHPDKTAALDFGMYRFGRCLVRRAVELAQPRQLPGLFSTIAARSHGQALAIFARELPKAAWDFRKDLLLGRPYCAPAGPRFTIGTPDQA